MQIDLSKLDLEGLTLALPVSPATAAQRRIEVRSALEVSGRLTSDGDGYQLSDADCMRLLLAGLDLDFGRVSISLRGEGELAGVLAQLERQAGKHTGRIESQVVDASGLVVHVGALRIAGRVHASQALLSLQGSAGELTAERAVFAELALTVGELSFEAPALEVTALRVAWGESGLQIAARVASCDLLHVTTPQLKLCAHQLVVDALSTTGANVQASSLSSARIEVAARFPAARAATDQGAPEAARTEAARALSYELLDGISGKLDVDVLTDLSVPVLGSRRATHPLRVAIDGGTIDYRALEANLAALEDALLDFSVREEGLVLEWGIPLVTQRGSGKPILLWTLSPEDLALARDQHVRLAVLPTARLASASSPTKPEPGGDERAPSRFALRSLAFQNVASELQLAARGAPSSGPLRALSFERLSVSGALQWDASEAGREGALRGELAGVEALLDQVALGSRALSAALRIAEVPSVELAFLDLRPTRVQCDLTSVTLTKVELGKRSAEQSALRSPV